MSRFSSTTGWMVSTCAALILWSLIPSGPLDAQRRPRPGDRPRDGVHETPRSDHQGRLRVWSGRITRIRGSVVRLSGGVEVEFACKPPRGVRGHDARLLRGPGGDRLWIDDVGTFPVSVTRKLPRSPDPARRMSLDIAVRESQVFLTRSGGIYEVESFRGVDDGRWRTDDRLVLIDDEELIDLETGAGPVRVDRVR